MLLESIGWKWNQKIPGVPKLCGVAMGRYNKWGNKTKTLLWRHNGCDGVSKHQPHDYLLNRLFRRRSNKTSKSALLTLCEGDSRVTAQRASNAENVSIWRRHHVLKYTTYTRTFIIGIWSDYQDILEYIKPNYLWGLQIGQYTERENLSDASSKKHADLGKNGAISYTIVLVNKSFWFGSIQDFRSRLRRRCGLVTCT